MLPLEAIAFVVSVLGVWLTTARSLRNCAFRCWPKYLAESDLPGVIALNPTN